MLLALVPCQVSVKLQSLQLQAESCFAITFAVCCYVIRQVGWEGLCKADHHRNTLTDRQHAVEKHNV